MSTPAGPVPAAGRSHGSTLLAPYAGLFAVPQAWRFSAAGVVARLPISTESLALVLLVQASTHSYGDAGAVASALGFASAAGAPPVARAVDRFAQSVVLPPVVAVHAGGLLALIAAVRAGWPLPPLLALAVLTGAANPQAGALVRARWAHALGGEAGLVHSAFALESVLDELVFIVGPVAVAFLATAVAPVAAVLMPAAALLVGGLALAAMRTTQPPATHAVAASTGRPLLLNPPIAVLAAAYVFVGGVFGSSEVSAVAFTAEHGNRSAAGAVLACFAVTSMVVGFVWGAISWAGSTCRRFAVVTGAFGVATAMLPLARGIAALAALLALAGLTVSPTLVTGLTLAESVAPAGRRTEALTWALTAMGLGTALSAVAAGRAIDAVGSRGGLVVCSACGVTAAVIAGAGMSLLAARGGDA